ncbi:MAG: hypothetical protein ABL964_07095 [Steroidobacteraceae bacterium]
MNRCNRSLIVLLMLASSPAWAGKRIQMESTDLQTNNTTPREVLVDKDRMKMEVGDNVVMFLTAGGNRMVMIDKANNEFREMDQASMEAMGKQLSNALSQVESLLKNLPQAQREQVEGLLKGKTASGAPVVEPVVFAARGPGTVSGFRCNRYDGTRSGEKILEICASTLSDVKLGAQEFQVLEKMREFTTSMIKAVKSTPLAGMLENTGITQAGIEGYPVQSITFQNGKAVSREQVKAIVDATFTDADFSTGTARKVDLPNLGALGGGAL